MLDGGVAGDFRQTIPYRSDVGAEVEPVCRVLGGVCAEGACRTLQYIHFVKFGISNAGIK